MKKNTLLCILIFTIISSCSKKGVNIKDDNIYSKTFVKTVSKPMTDQEKIIAYSSDKDYKFIISNSLEVINKLINSKVDLAKVNFSDLPTVLKILNMSKQEYLEKAIKVKNAAARFILRYNINDQGDNHFCTSCEVSDLQKASTVGKMLSSFQKNKVTYTEFTNRLTYDFSKNVSNSISTNSLVATMAVSSNPCSNWVYACITLCALTAETGPVYFLCCAYCIHAECPGLK
ncbi:MAG: hypothetical protein EO766_02835 [Hydrotalea sp. AMD]|uniref:hypothetical protein n=1 Tax=Hydrotalea sp. AMD TaxID=2501297 RepID=UPI0009438B61|nr:hypothetical protein [Hydrotalea sp. AMD]RWZ90356.1 MAG: hypothetical protein EO766_02835 [Hydrotalea sp. AMD]